MRALCLVLLSYTIAAGADLQALLDQHKRNPVDWKIANEVALAYTERSQFAEAANFFRKALVGNPGFVPARKNLGVVLWFAGNHSESAAVFRKLVVAIPNDPVPHLYLGLAAHSRAAHAEAHRHFAAAGDLAVANPDVVVEVLESYLAVRDQSVLDRTEKLLDATRDVQLSMRAAAIMDRYGAAPAAYRTYARAIEFAPQHVPLYIALASFASAHQNNRYGMEVLDRGLKQLPGSGPLLFHRGLLTAIDGDRETAVKEFSAAAVSDPKWALPRLAIGVLQLEDGRPEEAAATFAAVLTDHASDGQALYLRALALSRTSSDLTRPEQINLLERAVRVNPRDSRALGLLGQAYGAAGRTEDAINTLKKAVSADGRNATAHYQLALILRKAGQIPAANRHLVRFRELRAETDANESELVQFLKVER